MRVVEHYPSDPLPVQIEEFPDPVATPALIEDDEGFRYLLINPANDSIPVRTWAKAYQAGACMIISPDVGGRWTLLAAQTFITHRKDLASQAAYDLAPGRWWAYPNTLLFTDIVSYLPEEFTTETYTQAEMAARAGEEPRRPVAGRFVSVHTHSEYSALDGLSRLHEIVEVAAADGQEAVALTDHGVCAGHPELQNVCDAVGIRPIFGMEANFVEDRHRRPVSWEEPESENSTKMVKRTDAKEVAGNYQHMTLWAMDDAGLRNLWAMSTEAYREGHYYRPRLDWDTLERLNAGVMASTGCLRGPLAQKILAKDDIGARMVLGRLLDIFDGRLYVEIHTNTNPDQRMVNEASVRYAREYKIPLLACTDSHYPRQENAGHHKTWLAVQTNKDVTEDTGLFGDDSPYHMHTADEVEAALAYLPAEVVAEAMANTVALANRCTARISGAPAAPIYSKGENAVADDERRVREICEANWAERVVGKKDPESVYRERFEREMSLYVRKGFCGYCLVVEDICGAAQKARVFMSPCRGSGGGSLVLYLLKVTHTDPIKNNLMFERFLTEGRNSLPDVDMDFPASKRDWVKNYVRQRWGEDHTAVIGTQLRLASKGVINDSLRALKSTLTVDIDYTEFRRVSEIIDAAEASLAGKSLPWEDLWAQFGALLDPMRAKYPTVFAAADVLVGRLKTYGTHAGGVVISTDRSLNDLPQRLSDDGQMITQFDMHAIELLGYVKFDLLTLTTLDTIQDTLDRIEARYGKRIDPYAWDKELEDPQVWEQIADGRTLGLFQIETSAGTRLVRDFGPRSIEDLMAVLTLVRPGPSRSGLTDTYLRRRAGLEAVSVPDERMDFLEDSYGAVIYQEHVLQCCMRLAGYNETEADDVRKILGKKLVEKVDAAGEEFVRRAIECDTDPQVATALWGQLTEFAKYTFGRAHACGYALDAYYTGWLKFHFPVEFLVSVLSAADADRIPDFVTEARSFGYEVLPPDVNISGVHFTAVPEGIRYGLASIKGIKGAAVAIVAGQPYPTMEDFFDRAVTPTGSKVNMGHVKDLAAVGAFDSLFPNRRALEQKLDYDTSPQSTACTFKDETAIGPNGLPCTYDWAAESDPPMERIPVKERVEGGPVERPKAPPKRCTIACRHYSKPGPFPVELVVPYTRDDIMQRERELLGVWLSGTPFDRVSPQVLNATWTAADIERGPDGEYLTVGILTGVSEAVTKAGERYGWLTVATKEGNLRMPCWPKYYEQYRRDFVKDQIFVWVVRKDARGPKFYGFAPA